MQKIIIVAGGIVAKIFLHKIAVTYPHEYIYEIVCANDKVLPVGIPDSFVVRNFDPTSEYKLTKVITHEVLNVFIVLDSKEETEIALRTARAASASIQIVVLDLWGLQELCSKLKAKALCVNDTIANMLVHFLPNVPLVAQNIGLGNGEIMEVLVPYGSKYVFRHISNIEQKNWKIAALYRNNQLLLPKQNTMIRPGDELLLVGQPGILRDIFKSIKSELGQFPMPFGNNSYLFLDLSLHKSHDVMRICEESVSLCSALRNKKLFIKAVRPQSTKFLNYLRSLESGGVTVEIDFGSEDPCLIIAQDVKRLGVGFVVVDRKIFARKEYRKALFELKKPVLKLSKKRVAETVDSLVLLEESPNLEKISYVVFDISIQTGKQIVLADFDPDEISKDEIIEHYKGLSSIYSKKIKIEHSPKNPYREIASRDQFLQFLPFEKTVVNRSIKDLFNPTICALYTLADEHPQIFIPIND